ERVLADREQDVHAQVGAGDELRELRGKAAGPALARVVEKVLLALVEDHVQVSVEQVLPEAERVDEGGPVVGRADRTAERPGHLERDRRAEGTNGVAPPAVEYDDREPGLAVSLEARRGGDAKVVGDAG